MEAFIYKV